MNGRPISHIESSTFAPVIAIDQFCAVSGTFANRAVRSKSQKEMESSASAVGLGCIRGTVLALGCEAVAAVGMYAIWHLLRLLH